MSNSRTNPSRILSTCADVYAIEAERLRIAAMKGFVDDDDFQRLRAIHQDQAALEGRRSDALLVLLGAKLNVKDWTPEQLEAVSRAIVSGQEAE